MLLPPSTDSLSILPLNVILHLKLDSPPPLPNNKDDIIRLL